MLDIEKQKQKQKLYNTGAIALSIFTKHKHKHRNTSSVNSVYMKASTEEDMEVVVASEDDLRYSAEI